MDKEALKEKFRTGLHPMVLVLDRAGATPLTISVVGLLICILAGWIVARGSLFWGALVFLIGSGLDTLDGALARLQDAVSRRGAFLDSCFDRLGEAALFAGLAWYYMSTATPGWPVAVLMILLTTVGSLTTSYVRARAEGVGETCTVGLLQRPERVLLLGIGMILGWAVLWVVLVALALATLATTVQRMIHVAAKLPGPQPAASGRGASAGSPADADGNAADDEDPYGDVR